jgi:glycosyltransferase involved in cell wall biosynthesis
MKKNILFIAHDSSPFGANQSLINMISSIKDDKISYTVVFPDRGLICKQFDELGIEYHIVRFKAELCDFNGGIKNFILNKLRYFYKSIINVFALIELDRLVGLYDINIVHSNSSVIAIGEKLARSCRLRHIWHLREYIDLDHNLGVIGGIENYKKKIQNSDKIICISKGIAKHFGVQDNAFVLYNAVRKKGSCFQQKNKSNYFFFCGSLVKNKGIEEAIDAFCQVFKYNNNLKLLVAGNGSFEYEAYLKKKVNELNLQNNVEFLGFREDIDELMVNALAFLMCSKYEALGRVTIEAMLNCCLVIGFNNAGTAEIIENGKTGLLYQDCSELVNWMKFSITGEVNLDVIRKNAYNYACMNFLEEKFGNKLINYYTDLE